VTPDEILHIAVCNAVTRMNISVDCARSAELREVHDWLRQALIDYADAYMDQPVIDRERETVANKHRRKKPQGREG
jgi:hypothetical protein